MPVQNIICIQRVQSILRPTSKSQESHYLWYLQNHIKYLKATGKLSELLFVKESRPSGGSRPEIPTRGVNCFKSSRFWPPASGETCPGGLHSTDLPAFPRPPLRIQLSIPPDYFFLFISASFPSFACLHELCAQLQWFLQHQPSEHTSRHVFSQPFFIRCKTIW